MLILADIVGRHLCVGFVVNEDLVGFIDDIKGFADDRRMRVTLGPPNVNRFLVGTIEVKVE